MIAAKYLGLVLLAGISAFSLADDKVKIDPKWDKDTKVKLKHKYEFEVGGHKASVDSKATATVGVTTDGYTVNIHSDQLTVIADDNEVPVQFDDLKVGFDKKAALTSIEGGMQGTDPLRMFVVGHFFVPTEELTKDKAVQWTVKPGKLEIGELKIETTFLGQVDLPKGKGYKFKQKMSEDKTEFSSEGTFTVTTDGMVVSGTVEFKALPIPVTGSDATGKLTITTVE